MEWQESLFPEWGGSRMRDYTNAVLYAVVSIYFSNNDSFTINNV